MEFISESPVLDPATPVPGITPPPSAIGEGQLSAMVGDVTNALTTGDLSDPLYPATFMDQYQLTELTPGQLITINLSSNEFDPFLRLIDAATAEVIAADNDSGPGLDAQLQFTPTSGVNYLVGATSASTTTAETGNYILSSTFMDVMADLPVDPVPLPDTGSLIPSTPFEISPGLFYGYDDLVTWSSAQPGASQSGV
jgi:hypothetical protein